MKRAIFAALLIFAVIANPVLSLAVDCCEMPKHSHSQEDDQSSKSMHVDHHCCHANTLNAETVAITIAIDFTSSKFAVKQIQLRSLHEPSPLLEPPSQV